jgi:bacterioferritin-associated ferredoxin
MDLDSQLCYCFHIPKRKVANFVKQTRPRRASQISECFGAGTGCGWCVPFLREIHRKIMAGEVVETDSTSQAEYERLRKRYLSEVRSGDRKPNRHREAAAGGHGASSTDASCATDEAGGPAGLAAPIGEEALDYTRYFSRSRPEPEPEDLKARDFSEPASTKPDPEKSDLEPADGEAGSDD